MDEPQVTELLVEWQQGDRAALDQLMPIVYEELRRLASRYLRRERDAGVLQPTALIHEAFIRLVGQRAPEWQNRAHFFGVAAHLMREILVEHARRNQAAKRGGHWKKVTLDDATVFSDESPEEFLNFDSALRKLASFDARKSSVLELHFFGGLTVDETAEVLHVSSRTVARDLVLAQAWLRKEMTGTQNAERRT